MNIAPALLLCLFLEVDSLIEGFKCPPLTIRRGRVRLRSRGRIAKYTCIRGFQLLGDRYSTCLRGRWDTPAPVCISDGCFTVSNDFVHGQTFESYKGALVKFHCDPGFRLIGSPALYCNSISWNDTIPICKEITTKAQRWCDFESEDLCGWTHDMSFDFFWRRHNFATPSGHVGTGPAFDHTLGPGLDGHYMYLEASNPRLENDTARLFSPVFPALNSNDSCFIFWYHMYGATIGSLQVYIHAQEISLLFSESGNQGNQWLKGVVPLPPINTSFQIVIEGVRGAGYIGDTAIDDVKLTEGDECTDEPITAVSILGTCQGRCHSNITTDVSACDCTVDCIDNSTCCSDFLALCGMVPTSSDTGLTSTTTSIPVTNQSVLHNLPSHFIFPTKPSESVIHILTSTESPYNFTSFPITTLNDNTNPSLVTNRLHTSTQKIENNLQTSKLFSAPILFSTLKPATQNFKTSSNVPSIINTPTLSTSTKLSTIFVLPNLTSANTLPISNTTSPWYKIITFNRITTTPLKVFPTSAIQNVTKSTDLLTRDPNNTFISKIPVLFKPFTFVPRFKPTSLPNKIYDSVITSPKQISIVFQTSLPPIVFRKPQLNFDTKYLPKTTTLKVTLEPNLSTTIFEKRTAFPTKIPQFVVENNLTKNNILNPFWNKIKPPQSPTLGPKPDTKLTKLLIPTIGFPTHSTFTYSFDPQTTPVITNLVKKKYISKYKRRGVQAQVKAPDKKLTASIAAGLGLLILLLVAIAAITCYVRKRRINRRTNSDGEADVLFFTSDEILDFSLARPRSSAPSVCESQR